MDKNDYEQTSIQDKKETVTGSLKSIELGTKMFAGLKNVGMAESD